MFMQSMYDSGDERDAVIFAKVIQYYKPPRTFRHGEWELVATIPKNGNDGQPVEIWECRLPARFFRLVALPASYTYKIDKRRGPGKRTVTVHRKPGVLSTGSGDERGQLMVDLALEISEGMVGFRAFPRKRGAKR